MRSVRVLVGVVMLAACASPDAARAAVWRVEQDGSGDFTTLQPAVDVAATGDTILIGPGWYQELHWVDHFGSPIEVAAYWLDDRDLTFVGAGAGVVTIGPSYYSPYNDGPVGLFNERWDGARLTVSGVTFSNLYSGIVGADIDVRECEFQGGMHGVMALGAASRVRDSVFVGQDYLSCGFFSCNTAEVVGCSLGAYVYFGDTSSGLVRDCTANGKSLCYFFNSSGIVEGNDADCVAGALSIPVIAVAYGSIVEVKSNTIRGGRTGLTIGGPGTAVTLTGNLIERQEHHSIQLQQGATLNASGNDFHKSAGADRYIVMCIDYTGAVEPLVVSMENNFWGSPWCNQIALWVWDHNDDPNLMVEVDFNPCAGSSVPTEGASWGSLKSMFLGH